jgi:hypothetical protein
MTPNQNELAFWLSGLRHSPPLFSIFNRWEKAAAPLSPINKRSFRLIQGGLCYRYFPLENGGFHSIFHVAVACQSEGWISTEGRLGFS